MEAVGTLSAIVVGAVFAAAGAAKLRRRTVTSRAFAEMGLPAPDRLAAAVPAAELALAVVLVARPRAGGMAALAALAAFSAILARAALATTPVRCGCFGSAHGRPVSGADLVRNGLLAVPAAAALAAPTPVAPTLEAAVLVSVGALTGLVVLALCELRVGVGAVWDNRLAGKAAR